MNWSNVKLIWLREVRDQLRDRRTLFMIAVLPLLLYPLLGMSMLQVAQFLQDHPTKVLVAGWKPVAGLPPLIEQSVAAPKAAGEKATNTEKESSAAASQPPAVRFNSKWLSEDTRKLLEITLADPAELQLSGDAAKDAGQVRQLMQEKQYDVVVVFPADFAQRLEKFRKDLASRREPGKAAAKDDEVPSPAVFHS